MSFTEQPRTPREPFAALTALVVLGLLSSGCPQWTVIGNGVEATEARPLADFTEVSVGSFADSNIVLGSSFDVQITCDANLLQYFRSQVVGDVLIIDHAGGWDLRANIRGGCHVDVELQSLTKLSNAGSGIMKTDDVLFGVEAISNTGSGQVVVAGAVRPADHLEVTNTGSGRAEVRGVDVHDLRGSQEGSGSIFLAGAVREAVFVCDGSGQIDAEGLIAETVNVTLNGSGDVIVYATDRIEVVLIGSGDVIVHGFPQDRDVTISGSGTVVYQ